MKTDTFHQIWHGNSAELCGRFKPEVRPVDLVLTDPPFGVDNQSNQSVTAHGKEYARKIANDKDVEEAIAIYKEVMSVLLPKTAEQSDAYVFTSYQVLTEWLEMTNKFMPEFGFHRKAIIVWEKDGPGMGDTNCPWGMGSEFILFFQRGNREKSAIRRNNVIHVPQLRPNQLIHPHEKPTALLELLVKASSREGDFIVDPFGGSGSTVRAARRCNRNAVAIELDDKNYDLAKRKLDEEEEGLL